MQRIQMQLSQNLKILSQLLFAFPESTYYLKYFEKHDDPHRLFVSEIIDCKKRCYLNAKKAPFQNTYGQSTC